jgi:hypothetical protein
MKRLTIGRNEYISLPELNFADIDAKIDTGAYSCSIHCDDIRLDADGTHVRFRLLDDSHPDYHDRDTVLPVHEVRRVKSSNGTVEERIFVKTALELFGQVYETELSLTDRASMKYPMLIGRKYLEGRFVVDVALQYLAAKKDAS